MGKKKYVGLPYTKGSDTSKAAAESMVEPSKNQRYLIWELISRCIHGATCQEVERYLDICHQSCSTRMMELRQMGRLKYNGKTRKTESNREANVHVAVDPAEWIDKRPGWPCPENKSNTNMWKQRAYAARAAYRAACEEIKRLKEQLGGCND